MIVAFWMSTLAFASPNGKTGATSAGCTCHGRENSATTATLQADATEVHVGDVVNVTLLVEHATAKKAGLDIAAKGGTLAAGSNDQLSRNEITHKAPTALSGGSVTFDFTFTATTPGAARIYGVGLGANGDGHEGGDAWAFADDLTIDVLGDSGDTGGDTATDTGGDPGGDTATDTGGDTAAADTGDTGDAPPPCGCGTEAPWSAALAATGLLAGMARRRR